MKNCILTNNTSEQWLNLKIYCFISKQIFEILLPFTHLNNHHTYRRWEFFTCKLFQNTQYGILHRHVECSLYMKNLKCICGTEINSVPLNVLNTYRKMYLGQLEVNAQQKACVVPTFLKLCNINIKYINNTQWPQWLANLIIYFIWYSYDWFCYILTKKSTLQKQFCRSWFKSTFVTNLSAAHCTQYFQKNSW